MFYVGQQGAFDHMVHDVLMELRLTYPHINYTIVLERMPSRQTETEILNSGNTMLPEGIEFAHPRSAISWRNRWMLNQSDYVVTFIEHSWGGAAQFGKKSNPRKKRPSSIWHSSFAEFMA